MSVRLCVVFAALWLFACNNGAGSKVVLRIEAEMAGARCANGGVAVQTGFDLNSNDVLDEPEVTAAQTKYVCNGAPGTGGTIGPAGEPGDAGTPGLNALSVVTAEPAGTNCRYGGVRIDVGLDANADGALGTGEITSTRYVCDRASVDSVYFGDFTIRTTADVTRLEGIQVIAGSLTIESLPGGALTLPDLQVVSNRIVVTSPNGGEVAAALAPVTSARFPELRRAGELIARFNADLVSVAAPKLERLVNLDLSYLEAFTTLTLPQLAFVDDLFLSSNGVLTTLQLPALRQVQGFQVSAHATLATLTTPALTEVSGSLNISNNALLPTCAGYQVLKGLTQRPGSSYLGGNDETVTCAAADICATATVAGLSHPLARCVRPLAFTEAQATCATLSTGAALAWVTSDAEWQALSTAVSTGTFPAAGWLGYTDSAVEGTWVAVGGFTGYSPTARTDFWAPGEPSDTTSIENHLELYGSGLANDAAGTVLLPFTCRVP